MPKQMNNKQQDQVRGVRNLSVSSGFSAFLARASALGLIIAGVTASGFAYSQTSQESSDNAIDEIVVTGIRGSLNNAIGSKRNSVLSSESIAAEEIGKFPDLNLAEALQRTSGIAITRDNGEGQQISLRGLGPSFARVLWNGVPISTASNGGTDINASNREFDFDVFSSELFSRIDIAKSAAAHQVEGGVSGVINLRNVRPFDFDGFVANVTYKQGFQELADADDPNVNFIVSNTFADTFGVLVGVTYSERSFRVDGFETLDWVSQQASPLCWYIAENPCQAGITPSNVGSIAALAPNASGVSAETLDTLLVPRLPRTEIQFGTRERLSFVTALQYKPSDNFEVNFDALGANLESIASRHNLDVEIRNQNDLVPTNVMLDSNGRLMSIDLANANRRSENRTFNQETDQLHLALSASWQVTDNFKIDAVASRATSEYTERQITFLARLLDTGITIRIPGGSNPIPEVISSAADNIVTPAGYVFDSVRVGPLKREEINTAFHINGTWGEEDSNLRFGVASQTFERDQDGSRRSTGPGDAAFAPSLVDSANANPADLTNIASALPFNDYLDSLDATDDVFTDHLIISPAAMASLFNLNSLEALAPRRDGATNNAEETILSAYVEVNHATEFLERDLRLNVGARIVRTEVEASAPFGDNTLSGKSTYTNTLPSFNLAWNLRDNLIVRFSGARTMTRPDVAQIAPNTAFDDSFVVRSGNPELDPFLADQLDFGVEWYFARESLLAFSVFRKDLTGFIQNTTTQAPFSNSGIDIATLDTQIFANLTPETIVDYALPDNLPDVTEISGWELLYQQPLSSLVDGLGFLFSYSQVEGDTSFVAGDGTVVSSNIVGLSEESYNIVLYFERESFSVRGSWNFRDDYTTSPCCRNGQPFLRTREGSGQLDVSATYTLPFAKNVTLTLEGINLNDNTEYTFYGDERQLQRYITTGPQVFFGVRANF